MSMKLNLTEDESQSLYADKISLQNDWLAMHAELEVRAELIGRLEKEIDRLEKINEVLNLTIQDVY